MKEENVTDFIVQAGMDYKDRNNISTNVEVSELESDVLHRKLFNVNMRIYRSNRSYKILIEKIADYMKKIMLTKFDNYPKLKGLSGANIGVPFNIIAVKRVDEDDDLPVIKETLFCLNPVVIKRSKKKRTVKSNCGSLNLTEPVEVERSEWIDLEYYDLDGTRQVDRFEGRMASTIQHEVEHNLGILITDEEAGKYDLRA